MLRAVGHGRWLVGVMLLVGGSGIGAGRHLLDACVELLDLGAPAVFVISWIWRKMQVAGLLARASGRSWVIDGRWLRIVVGGCGALPVARDGSGPSAGARILLAYVGEEADGCRGQLAGDGRRSAAGVDGMALLSGSLSGGQRVLLGLIVAIGSWSAERRGRWVWEGRADGEEDGILDMNPLVVVIILAGLDRTSAHLAGARRRQPWLPAMEMTMEHHTGAPAVY
ncbi:hypothetical protein ACLOJK_028900 [Asimina triloba]